MTFKQKASIGQIIELNGQDYIATANGFELVDIKKGPLGGELKMFADCKVGDVVYLQMVVESFDRGHVMCKSLFEKGAPHAFFQTNRLVETNIPARPTFTPMTAGEAARIHNMAGRWIAVKVDSQDGVMIHLEAARNLALISVESLDMIEPFTSEEMKTIRSRLGLGQGDFAKLTGHIISRETFTRIENGAEIEAKTTAFIRFCLAYRLPDFSFVDKEKYGRKKIFEYKARGV